VYTHDVLCGSSRATLVFPVSADQSVCSTQRPLYVRRYSRAPDPVSHFTDALVQALRGIEPKLRQQAIADALAQVTDEERRRELMKKVQELSTDELERRLNKR
jgi:hypothetical protein